MNKNFACNFSPVIFNILSELLFPCEFPNSFHSLFYLISKSSKLAIWLKTFLENFSNSTGQEKQQRSDTPGDLKNNYTLNLRLPEKGRLHRNGSSTIRKKRL